jgi:hypothetical protein
MKKIIFILSLVTVTTHTFAQEKDKSSGKNEIKFNIPMAIAALPEINYERAVDENVGIGLAFSIAAEKPTSIAYRTLAMPYARLYFGKKKTMGFFIETNVAAAQQHRISDKTKWVYDTINPYGTVTNIHIDESSFNIGFGGALGVKFITKNAYVGELFAGGGRLFGNSVKNGYFRMGLSIGKRF